MTKTTKQQITFAGSPSTGCPSDDKNNKLTFSATAGTNNDALILLLLSFLPTDSPKTFEWMPFCFKPLPLDLQQQQQKKLHYNTCNNGIEKMANSI